MSTRVRVTLAESFLNQIFPSIIMIKNPNAFIRLTKFHMEYTESDHAIRCTCVLSVHLYR